MGRGIGGMGRGCRRERRSPTGPAHVAGGDRKIASVRFKHCARQFLGSDGRLKSSGSSLALADEMLAAVNSQAGGFRLQAR